MSGYQLVHAVCYMQDGRVGEISYALYMNYRYNERAHSMGRTTTRLALTGAENVIAMGAHIKAKKQTRYKQ